jgi:hypothetical protein
MPVTLISSHPASGGADRVPGVAVAWWDRAPAGGFSRAAGCGWLEASRRRIGRAGQRVRTGGDWRSSGACRAGETVVVLGGGVV